MDELVVVFPFLGSEIGGSHMSGFILGDGLVEHGVRCVVLCPGDTLISREAEARGFDVVPTGEAPSARNNPLVDLARLARRRQILADIPGRKILHFNDLSALQAWVLPAKALGIPVVYHSRAFNRMIPPNTTIIRLADASIAISREVEAALRFLPKEKVFTLTDPFSSFVEVDHTQARSRLMSSLGIPADALVASFVGNFWLRKRPEFFLEAAAVLARLNARVHFVFFGRAGDLSEDDLRALANRLGIADRVHFAGFRLPAEENIAASDILMLPSVREPFGRTLVEALLLGTPYVATDDAGHNEIGLRWGGGRLVPLAASPEAFAQTVNELLLNPSPALLSMSRRAEVAQELTPLSHAAAVLDVYTRVDRRS